METMKRTLRELVNENLHSADVLEKYGLDYCCGGADTLENACRANGVDADAVLTELESLPNGATAERYYLWDLGFLADYIVNNHHEYVRSSIPSLQEYLEKIVDVHGKHHPELLHVRKLFGQLADELNHHLLKEEVMLFPYIKALVTARSKGVHPPRAAFGTVANPIHIMMNDHDTAGDVLREIRETLDDFNPPPDACTTMNLAYRKLEEFERDLHMHVFLENSVLFPRTLKVESELKSVPVA
jgi:regulator of cell morphogenesis and NO signaling